MHNVTNMSVFRKRPTENNPEGDHRAEKTPHPSSNQTEKPATPDDSSRKPPFGDAQIKKVSISRDVPIHKLAGVENRVEKTVLLDRRSERIIHQNPDETVNHSGTGKPAESDQPPRKKRILLIEDDPIILKLLEMGLRKHEFECQIAQNGKAAQPLLQNNRPDIIMVDLMMPVMDGLAFIQWLRHTAQDSTPIVVFSTVDDPKVISEVLKSGADHFAPKPLQLAELVKVLDKLARRPR